MRCNVDATKHIDLNVDEGTVFYEGQVFHGVTVYTGMLDQLFAYVEGELQYRSLQFEFSTLNQAEYQPATTVNYPNDHAFTRITEFKKILGQTAETTTIVKRVSTGL